MQPRLVDAPATKFGHTAIAGDGCEAALRLLDGPHGGEFGVIILDLSMLGLDGIGVLKAMRARGITLPIIVQIAQGYIETVASVMSNGAFDFSCQDGLVGKAVGSDRQCAQGLGGRGSSAAHGEDRQRLLDLSRYGDPKLRHGPCHLPRSECFRIEHSYPDRGRVLPWQRTFRPCNPGFR